MVLLLPITIGIADIGKQPFIEFRYRHLPDMVGHNRGENPQEHLAFSFLVRPSGLEPIEALEVHDNNRYFEHANQLGDRLVESHRFPIPCAGSFREKSYDVTAFERIPDCADCEKVVASLLFGDGSDPPFQHGSECEELEEVRSCYPSDMYRGGRADKKRIQGVDVVANHQKWWLQFGKLLHTNEFYMIPFQKISTIRWLSNPYKQWFFGQYPHLCINTIHSVGGCPSTSV